MELNGQGKKSRKWILVCIAIIVLVTGSDLLSKYYIVSEFDYHESRQVIGELVKFSLTYNEGMVFGLFNGNNSDLRPYILVLMSSIVTVIVFIMMVKLPYFVKEGKPVLYGRYILSMIIGGSFGNNIDRLINKAVVDFIDVGLGPNLRWYVFNIADSFLVVGSISMAVLFLFFEAESVNKDHHIPEQADTGETVNDSDLKE